MDSILGIVIAITLSALIGAGYYVYESSQVTAATDALIAVREARALVRFTDALNTYVQANQGNISGSNAQSTPLVVTPAMMNLPASAGVDALGQTLEGVVATPYGQAQSWMVIPVSAGVVSYSTPTGGTAYATTAQILQKYDLNAPMDAERFWGQVAADIVKISSGKINGYVYNNVNQAFVPSLSGTLVTPGNASPTGGTGAWDALAHYFPSNGVPYPQSLPAPYAPHQFSIIASSALSKSPGYWLWAMELYNNWGSGTPQVSASFYSVGYSPGCPAGGITPQAYPGAVLSSGWSGSGNAGMQNTTTDPAMGQNHSASYVCLPMSSTTYNQIAPNFNYAAACTTDGIGCGSYIGNNGAQTGYNVTCNGADCQTSNPADGEGWSAGNNGYPQGEGSSESFWINNSDNGGADYLYGTYLIHMPGGFSYSLFWSSGFNFDRAGDWADYQNQIGLFSGNVVSAQEYTVGDAGGYQSNPWAFTVDGDPANVGSPQNQNFTTLNLK